MATRGGLESAKASGSIGDRSKNGSPGDASGEGGSGKNDRNNRGNKPSKAQENRAVAEKPERVAPPGPPSPDEEETFAERNRNLNDNISYGGKLGNGAGTYDSGAHPRDRGSFAARGVTPGPQLERGGNSVRATPPTYSGPKSRQGWQTTLNNWEARTPGVKGYFSRQEDYFDVNQSFFEDIGEAVQGFFGFTEKAPTYDTNNLSTSAGLDFSPGVALGNVVSLVNPIAGAVLKTVNSVAGDPFKSSLDSTPVQRSQSFDALGFGLGIVSTFGGPYLKTAASLTETAIGLGKEVDLIDEDFGQFSIDQTGTQASGSTKQGVSASRTGDLPERGEGGVRRQVVRSRTGSAVSASASAAPGRTSFGLGVSRSTSANRGFLGLDEQVPLVERLYGRVR
ncbi:hypothetical protein [Kiloniella sp. b19]|uniref:hypothetical protein n=1 Tax=Kiloniella sp. GXU_MW_B19 TaxID=3141326 RepID=UPI0031D270EF